jgi:proline dehydrogenase
MLPKMLPNGLGWTSLILTVLFGGLNVLQFVQGLLNKGRVDSALAQLEAIRALCEEAVVTEEAINTGPAKQFVRSVAFQIGGIERGLRGTKGKDGRVGVV